MASLTGRDFNYLISKAIAGHVMLFQGEVESCRNPTVHWLLSRLHPILTGEWAAAINYPLVHDLLVRSFLHLENPWKIDKHV